RDQANSLLDMAKMRRNSQKRDAEKPFLSHFRDLQGVKLLSLPFRQDLLDCPAQGSQLLATKCDCPDLAGQIEEAPLHFRDFLAKSVHVEILDNSPAGQEGFTCESQDFRQECALLDQDGPRLDGVWHLGSSRRLQRHIVWQHLAPAVSCFRWTQYLC